VGPRAGLDVYEKSRPHWDSIPGPYLCKVCIIIVMLYILIVMLCIFIIMLCVLLLAERNVRDNRNRLSCMYCHVYSVVCILSDCVVVGIPYV
jgi:hypothetical protein